MTHQRLNLVVAMEGGCDFVDRIRANRVGHALDGVIQLHGANPCPTEGHVSSHPANQRNWLAGIVQQFLGQFRGSLIQWDTVGQKCGEARNLPCAALNQHIAGGLLSLDVLGNRLLKVAVNPLIAAEEDGPIVFGEGF